MIEQLLELSLSIVLCKLRLIKAQRFLCCIFWRLLVLFFWGPSGSHGHFYQYPCLPRHSILCLFLSGMDHRNFLIILAIFSLNPVSSHSDLMAVVSRLLVTITGRRREGRNATSQTISTIKVQVLILSSCIYRYGRTSLATSARLRVCDSLVV